MATVDTSIPITFNNYKELQLKGEGTENKFGAHILPPCKVCGAQATGYHYGANTCEACKGFFHRSLNKKDTYVCLKNTKCILRPGNRSLCPHCRYKRCVEIGMSKSGIKTGRYSYAKRTQDILELKAMTKHESIQQPSPPLPRQKPTGVLFSEERIKTIMYCLSKLRESRDKFIAAQVQSTNSMQVEMLKSKLGSTIDPTVIDAISSPVNSNHVLSSFAPKLSSNDILASLNGGSIKETDIVKKWIEVLGGRSGPITMMVSFIKGIPGFTQLPMNDQIQLLKHSIIEIWMLARHNMFDTKSKKFKTVSGFSLDLSTTLGNELSSAMLQSVSRIQKLSLDKDIVFILVAFVAVSSDRCELTKQSDVMVIQENIMDLLLFTLYNKFGEDQYLKHYARIISALTELRSATEVYLKMTNVLISNLNDVPPLLAEILTLSSSDS